MSPFFLTHVEPLHPQKGKEVLFFLRKISSGGDKATSHVVIKEIPHYFYTGVLSRDEAEGLFQELQQKLQEQQQEKPEFNHLTLELKHYNLNRAFFRASGSKEDKRFLPPPFLCNYAPTAARDPLGLNSPTKLLNWFYPPGMLIASPEEIPLPEEINDRNKERKYVSLEHLINDSQAILDIEVEDWEFGRDHIFMAVYASPEQKVLFHDLPFTDPEQEGFQLVSFTSPQDLGDKLTTILHQDDPLWLFGHNIMNYDQIKIRDLTGRYFPAVNAHYPVTKATQGFGRVLTKGRWTLDSYNYARNYQNFHASSSLGTLSDLKVPLGHFEQARLVKEARKGSKRAFEELAHYCIGDEYASEEMGQRFKSLAAVKTLHFGLSPDIICSTSKRRIAYEHWNKRHFFTKDLFADTWKRWREESSFSLEKLAEPCLFHPTQQGFYEGVQAIYLTPFVGGAKEIIHKTAPSLLSHFYATRNAKRFCALKSTALGVSETSFLGVPERRGISGHSKNSREKYDLLQTLNAQQAFLVEKSLRILEPELRWRGKRKEERASYKRAAELIQHPPTLDDKQRAKFYCLFAYRGLDIEPTEFLESLARSIQLTNKALQRYEVINAGKFHFIRGNVNVSQLEENLYGCWLGQGPVLSLSSGRTVANPFHAARPEQYLYDGFNPCRGEKTHFERRILERLVKDIFGGIAYREIKKYLDEELAEFSAGKKPQEDYYMPISARTYYSNLLESILGERSFAGHLPEQAYTKFQALQEQRLKRKLSRETEKMLAEIIEQCRNDFSYPFIHEYGQELLQPYPWKVNLVYVPGIKVAVPMGLAERLDFRRYAEKVQRQFQDFYEVLGLRQMKLAL